MQRKSIKSLAIALVSLMVITLFASCGQNSNVAPPPWTLRLPVPAL